MRLDHLLSKENCLELRLFTKFLLVDSFRERKFEERSIESYDSRRGIGNSLEQLLFSFERPDDRGSKSDARGPKG